jgi:hypothetical protein
MKIIIECDIKYLFYIHCKIIDFLTKLQKYYVNKKIYKRNKIKDYVRFNKYIIIRLIVIVMKNNRHNNE